MKPSEQFALLLGGITLLFILTRFSRREKRPRHGLLREPTSSRLNDVGREIWGSTKELLLYATPVAVLLSLRYWVPWVADLVFVVRASLAVVLSGALLWLTWRFLRSEEEAHWEKPSRTGIYSTAIIGGAALTAALWINVLRSKECDATAAAVIFAFAYFFVGMPTVSMWRDARKARLKREAAELERFARWVARGSDPQPDTEYREQWEFERAARASVRNSKNEKQQTPTPEDR